jgi:fructose-1-phosphate kinase PfkB-like protein
MKNMVVLGGNPAYQKIISFKDFHCGNVNRANDMEICASGKGINFCRAAQAWNKVPTLLFQFVGGSTGEYIANEVLKENLTAQNIWVDAPTRCCITCCNNQTGEVTEIIEPSGSCSDSECNSLLVALESQLPNACGMAFCGTLPGKTDPKLYVDCAKLAAKYKIPVLLDAYKDIEEVLTCGADIYLKINKDELGWLTNQTSVVDGMKWVFARYENVKIICITDGPKVAYASDRKVFATYTIPKVKVVNPIGCGDTASAILFSELLSNNDIVNSFLMALAAASANCLSWKPAMYEVDKALELSKLTEVEVVEL